jgi:HNH endonuclease
MKRIRLLPVPQSVRLKAMRGVGLTRSYFTIVDDEDYDAVVAAGPWHVRPDKKTFYASHTTARGSDGKQKTVALHRFLLGITDPRIKVDHRDGDGLNNQRGNLRIATSQQNSANHRTRSGRFHGVQLHSGGKWQAHIRVNRKLIHLGTFTDKVQAARAYDEAAREHFGEFANTNFMKEGN